MEIKVCFICKKHGISLPRFMVSEQCFIISAKYRPKHFKYEGVTTWDHSSYDCFINALKAQSEGLIIHSEPFVELLGIPLLYNHTINDADLVRSFFNSDKASAPQISQSRP